MYIVRLRCEGVEWRMVRQVVGEALSVRGGASPNPAGEGASVSLCAGPLLMS